MLSFFWRSLNNANKQLMPVTEVGVNSSKNVLDLLYDIVNCNLDFAINF